MNHYKAIKLTEKLYWVGAIDWGIRDFHGYQTKRGTTYNAFLIIDDKITLIDTVKKEFAAEMLSRIKSVTELKNISYVVSNHAEMDHSGSLAYFADIIKPEKIYASPTGKKALMAHFPDFAHEITAVKTGDKVCTGNSNLHFVETKMLHWPDSMFTYLDSQKALFSQDAFGMHLATSQLYARDNSIEVMKSEAKKYFANILTPFSNQVSALLKKMPDLIGTPSFILPDHGPLWTEDCLETIVKIYQDLSSRKLSNKAVIVYDTMWKSTETMARHIVDGILQSHDYVKVMPIYGSHRSEIATEIIDAKVLLAGSSTLNNNLLPSVADILTYIKGLKFNGMYVQAFGSYGWSGESIKQVSEYLQLTKPAGWIGEPVKSQYVPDGTILQKCFELGVQAGKIIKPD